MGEISISWVKSINKQKNIIFKIMLSVYTAHNCHWSKHWVFNVFYILIWQNEKNLLSIKRLEKCNLIIKFFSKYYFILFQIWLWEFSRKDKISYSRKGKNQLKRKGSIDIYKESNSKLNINYKYLELLKFLEIEIKREFSCKTYSIAIFCLLELCLRQKCSTFTSWYHPCE